jgi:translocator protein
MIKSWMVIGAVTLLVSLGSLLVKPEDNRWFRRLRRPRWLVFEAAIPVIWTVIFVCAAWSAVLVWEAAPFNSVTWGLMLGYLLLEMLVIAYIPVTLRLRNLRLGTLVGGLGAVVGLVLAFLVSSVDIRATFLLLPYLLWSPIGTFTTQRMDVLNAGRGY